MPRELSSVPGSGVIDSVAMRSPFDSYEAQGMRTVINVRPPTLPNRIA